MGTATVPVALSVSRRKESAEKKASGGDAERSGRDARAPPDLSDDERVSGFAAPGGRDARVPARSAAILAAGRTKNQPG